MQFYVELKSQQYCSKKHGHTDTFINHHIHVCNINSIVLFENGVNMWNNKITTQSLLPSKVLGKGEGPANKG